MIQAMRMFPHDAAAEQWFIRVRWPQGPQCPHCGAGSHRVQSGAKHKTMPFRCRACRKRFSVRSGTVMQHSNLGYQVWAMAIYLFTTSLKSVSSMKLHRDLDIAQNSAWHLSHRIRAALCSAGTGFAGPVEVDETYLGGKRKNMPNAVRKQLTGRGPVGKTAVVGAKDRATKQVVAKAVPATDKHTLQGFVKDHADRQATVYTDEARAYETLPFEHESVKHSVSEYVRGQAHTNGVESFWSMLKRGYYGTFHKLSPKHLDRYVQEFAGRHNLREQDTIDMMGAVVLGMDGKRLMYEDLIRDNGLDSGARG
jgi:transposase-like protein